MQIYKHQITLYALPFDQPRLQGSQSAHLSANERLFAHGLGKYLHQAMISHASSKFTTQPPPSNDNPG
jgi:hypothetical protein